MIVPGSRLRPSLARRSPWIVAAVLAVLVLLAAGAGRTLGADPSPSASASASASSSASVDPTPSAPPTPTGTPQRASIRIAVIDDNATSDVADDVLLDGARLEVRAEDGDRRYDPDRDPLVFGPRAAPDGLLQTRALDGGWYWIVETRAPKGFIGSAAVLVELNLDPTVICVWDRGAPSLCPPSVDEADSTSWTIVLVYNTPRAPTPGVAEDRGRGPSITLPPTHVLTGPDAPAPAGVGWASVLAAFAVFSAVVLRLTPGRRPQRQGPRSTRTPGSTNSTGPS